MASFPNIYLVIMTSHDYLFFASQDYGASAKPANLLNNYALMYAINRDVSPVRRVISGTQPHYEEDMPLMRTYATPAARTSDFPYDLARTAETKVGSWLSRQRMVGSRKLEDWREEGLVKITWNSIGSSLLDVMKRDNINVPKKGHYYKHQPLCGYYFYVIGDEPPDVIRLGKKYTSVRLETCEMNGEIGDGRFQPTCPVNVNDLPENTHIHQGSLLTIPPSPILVNAELEGEHIIAKDDYGYKHICPIPEKSRFASSFPENEGN